MESKGIFLFSDSESFHTENQSCHNQIRFQCVHVLRIDIERRQNGESLTTVNQLFTKLRNRVLKRT